MNDAQLDDVEYLLPSIGLPTLESVLSELDSELDSTDGGMAPTPTPSMDDNFQRSGSILRHMVLQGIKSQISSAAVSFTLFHQNENKFKIKL